MPRRLSRGRTRKRSRSSGSAASANSSSSSTSSTSSSDNGGRGRGAPRRAATRRSTSRDGRKAATISAQKAKARGKVEHGPQHVGCPAEYRVGNTTKECRVQRYRKATREYEIAFDDRRFKNKFVGQDDPHLALIKETRMAKRARVEAGKEKDTSNLTKESALEDMLEVLPTAEVASIQDDDDDDEEEEEEAVVAGSGRKVERNPGPLLSVVSKLPKTARESREARGLNKNNTHNIPPDLLESLVEKLAWATAEHKECELSDVAVAADAVSGLLSYAGRADFPSFPGRRARPRDALQRGTKPGAEMFTSSILESLFGSAHWAVSHCKRLFGEVQAESRRQASERKRHLKRTKRKRRSRSSSSKGPVDDDEMSLISSSSSSESEEDGQWEEPELWSAQAARPDDKGEPKPIVKPLQAPLDCVRSDLAKYLHAMRSCAPEFQSIRYAKHVTRGLDAALRATLAVLATQKELVQGEAGKRRGQGRRRSRGSSGSAGPDLEVATLSEKNVVVAREMYGAALGAICTGLVHTSHCLFDDAVRSSKLEDGVFVLLFEMPTVAEAGRFVDHVLLQICILACAIHSLPDKVLGEDSRACGRISVSIEHIFEAVQRICKALVLGLGHFAFSSPDVEAQEQREIDLIVQACLLPCVPKALLAKFGLPEDRPRHAFGKLQAELWKNARYVENNYIVKSTNTVAELASALHQMKVPPELRRPKPFSWKELVSACATVTKMGLGNRTNTSVLSAIGSRTPHGAVSKSSEAGSVASSSTTWRTPSPLPIRSSLAHFPSLCPKPDPKPVQEKAQAKRSRSACYILELVPSSKEGTGSRKTPAKLELSSSGSITVGRMKSCALRFLGARDDHQLLSISRECATITLKTPKGRAHCDVTVLARFGVLVNGELKEQGTVLQLLPGDEIDFCVQTGPRSFKYVFKA